jgi:S1-C subfamily serine protease
MAAVTAAGGPLTPSLTRRGHPERTSDVKARTGLALIAGMLALQGSVAAQTVGQVFDKVNPSVVVIRARGHDAADAGSGLATFGETGSGVLISADGKVMTAAHVVQAMDEINVEFIGGDTVKARVIASEPAADLSLLQLERVPAGALVARLADSSTVRVGDQIIVVGAPYGLSHSLTTGLISARWPPNTIYRKMPLAEFFQTDAVINTGNSGGPMFSMKGEVVGIVSHNISKSGGSEGLGFVVTINTAKLFLLEKHSFWSGMEGELISGRMTALFNVPQPVAYLVEVVAKDSPSSRAGLRGGDTRATVAGQTYTVGGDIILKIDGIALATVADLVKVRERLGGLPSGTAYTITVLRAGKVQDLTGRVP